MHNQHYSKHCRGFTLLEVLLVMAILVVLSTIGSTTYWGFYKKTELNSTVEAIKFDLKRAQGNAMSGINGVKWGVHYVNTNAGNYYELFSSPTVYGDVSTTIDAMAFLPKGIVFIDPIVSSTKDIIFNKIRGTTVTSTSITIFSSVTSETRLITINAAGTAY